MTKLVVGSATDVGLVRANNQDQYLVVPGLYAVADGMGGHAAGEVASLTAIESLRAAFEQTEHHTANALVGAAKTANRAVWDQARANRGMLGMGTTLVALAVVEESDNANGMAVAHIGDSRAYVFRDGQLRQLTTDHSLVQELVADGQITEEEAAVHPQRHVLTRALGVEPSVEVDLLHLGPQHGDRYLLCSDGLPREASSEQIASVLARFADPAEAAKELVNLANARGGSDNVTVVVVDVMANDPTGETLLVVPGPATSTGPSPRLPPVMPPAQANVDRTPAVTGPPPAPGRSRPPATAGGGTGRGAGRHLSAQGRPGSRHRGSATPRRITARVVTFVIVAVLVLAGAVAGLDWYARSSYYVTIYQGRIVIYQGRPGGVLWFDPSLKERTAYTEKSVLAFQVQTLEAGHLEPSLQAAQQYIATLVQQKQTAVHAGTPPSETSTTTSTVPRHPKTTTTVTPSTVPSTTKGPTGTTTNPRGPHPVKKTPKA